ncbi:uncharacterized protein LOC121593966 [Anopheles merus]|nr:uncharacterized protein LOC121593966 [Anopheles merus]XP_041772709.1 uncharacterized protein LOC121593966 [Anopheles merus]XP_041772710.1 uncharacterized protein LOC121593966 [Anopheles merus]
MDPLGGCRNYQLLSVLAQRICSLVVCLIKHVQQENGAVQSVLRQALLPMHRALTEFLFGQAHSSQHFSPLQLRGSTHSLLSLPSMPLYPNHPSVHQPTLERFPSFRGNITPPEGSITPPRGSTPPSWLGGTPIGFTSTPLRTPTVRPQPEPFALINQLLTAMRTSNGGNLSNVTEQYASDPVFRERALRELDELRSCIAPQLGGACNGAGQAVRALLDRVEQAEITLSMLINNLEQLQNH